MPALEGYLISALDLARVAFLRAGLKLRPLRSIFLDRPRRLFAWFLLACLFYLPLALIFPLWVLAIGPMIWGVPHVLASFRYVHAGLEPKGRRELSVSQFWRWTSLVFMAIFVLRLLTQSQWLKWAPLHSSYVDLSLLVISFLVAGVLARNSRWTRPSLFIAPVVAAAWLFPLELLGILILAHNFIAFVYWIHFAQGGRERKYAVAATAVFSLLHVAIFAGMFDGLYKVIEVPPTLVWAGLNYGDLGEMIAPWTQDYVFWFHAVVAYAFGQSLHYFVWLKAIPETHSTSATPLSFRRSYFLMLKEFGRPVLVLAGLLTLGLVAVWALASYPLARDLYFLLALHHGFMELGSLPWLRSTASV